jgi:hypothetical protein
VVDGSHNEKTSRRFDKGNGAVGGAHGHFLFLQSSHSAGVRDCRFLEVSYEWSAAKPCEKRVNKLGVK